MASATDSSSADINFRHHTFFVLLMNMIFLKGNSVASWLDVINSLRNCFKFRKYYFKTSDILCSKMEHGLA